MESDYLTTITPEEVTAGFVLIEIENPDIDQSAKLPAVVYRHGPSHRLVKLSRPGGGHYYHLEVFALSTLPDPGEKPSWQPLKDEWNDIDPIQLTEALAKWISENPNPHLTVHVPRKPRK